MIRLTWLLGSDSRTTCRHQHSTAQHSTAHHDAARHDARWQTALHGTVKDGAAWHDGSKITGWLIGCRGYQRHEQALV
jgi:hypothetical protein